VIEKYNLQNTCDQLSSSCMVEYL